MPRIKYEIMGGLSAVIKSLKGINAEHPDRKSFVVAEVNIFAHAKPNAIYRRARREKMAQSIRMG